MSSEAVSVKVGRRMQTIAWVTLCLSLVTFVVLCGAIGAGGWWYWTHATGSQEATLELTGGDAVFVKSVAETQWRQASNHSRIKEGDSIRALGESRALVTLFDGSTIQLFPNTEITLTQLRSTRYIARSKTAIVSLRNGAVRIGVAPLGDFSRFHFEVISPDPQASTIFKDAGGSYRVEVSTTGKVPLARFETRRGEAQVLANGGEVILQAEQKSTVRRGEEPSPASSAIRELLSNADFSDGTNQWSEIRDQGGDGGSLDGTVSVVDDMIDGKPVKAAEFARFGGNKDHAMVGLHQEVDAEVADFTNTLQLRAKIKLLDQSLSGGGFLSSEYPLIIKIIYREAQGDEEEWFQGFYYQNRDNNPTRDGKLVQQGVWEDFQVDLRTLRPQPFTVKSIDVYASGHDFDSMIGDIHLVAD